MADPKEALNKETFDWKQSKLEEGKIPCECGHFESAHHKTLCLPCHSADGDNCSHCWHKYYPMDNLALIEWIAKHKENEDGNV